MNPLTQSTNAPRTKRGLINGLGTAIKFFTGNLDEYDRQRYDQAIEILTKNQSKFKVLIKDQISLFQNSISSFNSTTSKLIENQLKLSDRIALIEEYTQRKN